jgi:hypothetical protein
MLPIMAGFRRGGCGIKWTPICGMLRTQDKDQTSKNHKTQAAHTANNMSEDEKMAWRINRGGSQSPS